MILAIYVVILTTLSLLILTFSVNINPYSNYGNNPQDENIRLTVQVTEHRTHSPLSDSTTRETANWYFRVYLDQKDQEKVLRNVNCYIAIQYDKNSFVYKEKQAATMTGYTNPASSDMLVTDRTYYTTFPVGEKTSQYSSVDKNYTNKSTEPTSAYVRLSYEIKEGDEDVRKELTYQFDLLKAKDQKFDKYRETNIEEDATSKQKVIQTIYTYRTLKIKLQKKSPTKLTEGEVKTYDRFYTNIYYTPEQLYEGIEVGEVALALYIETENDKADKDEYFSNLIEMVSYYGAMPTHFDVVQTQSSYDSLYKSSKVYMYSKAEIDGETREDKVYIKLENIPEY